MTKSIWKAENDIKKTKCILKTGLHARCFFFSFNQENLIGEWPKKLCLVVVACCPCTFHQNVKEKGMWDKSNPL